MTAFRFIPPCNPIRAKEVPAGHDWLHEVKFDGYRAQVHKVGSRVVIYSRNGHDFTERFSSIAHLLHELPAKAVVIDGEVVASDADGRPRCTYRSGECRDWRKVKTAAWREANRERWRLIRRVTRKSRCLGTPARIAKTRRRWDVSGREYTTDGSEKHSFIA